MGEIEVMKICMPKKKKSPSFSSIMPTVNQERPGFCYASPRGLKEFVQSIKMLILPQGVVRFIMQEDQGAAN